MVNRFFGSCGEYGMRTFQIIEVDYETLEARGGHGESVAQIVVTDSEGRRQVFNVSLYAKNNGVSCSVSAQRLNLPQDVSKSVRGCWRRL